MISLHTLFPSEKTYEVCIYKVLWFGGNIPSSITYTGTPLAPVITEVKLLEDSSDDKSYNLSFSWETKPEELRPITSFSVTVTLSSPAEKDDENTEQDNIISQPSTVYMFTVDGNTTQHTIVDIPLAEEYTVEVCSHNRFGVNCSDPATYPGNATSPGPSRVKNVDDDDDDDGLPAGAIAAIVLLVIAVLFCCCVLIWCLLLFFCCYCDELWRSYHPEKRGMYKITCHCKHFYVYLTLFSFKEKKNEIDFKRLVYMPH